MEIICVPPTAATKRLHLGNLYNWILIDVYKKSMGESEGMVLARETWNCFSQKLENEVSQENPNISKEDLVNLCIQRTEEAINSGRKVFSKYDIRLDGPVLKDNSTEYIAFVKDWIKKKELEGDIRDGILKQPDFPEVIKRAKDIAWIPEKNTWQNFYGIEDQIEFTEVRRKGFYGINFGKDEVIGQRIVQSLLPIYYSERISPISLGLFGRDVLTKWIYFMISNGKDLRTFERLGLTGLVLGKDNKKISKYDISTEVIENLNEHPDNVRLGFVKQSFGRDFIYPNFSEEEKIRRKAYNAFKFIRHHSKLNENSTVSPSGSLKIADSNIRSKIKGLKFHEAYQTFRGYIFDNLSAADITNIRQNGIGSEELARTIKGLRDIFEIFIPVTNREI